MVNLLFAFREHDLLERNLKGRKEPISGSSVGLPATGLRRAYRSQVELKTPKEGFWGNDPF